MIFDEVIAKSYEKINCFKLFVVLMVLVMLLLGSILFVEPLMASLTFYHVPCPANNMICYGGMPFLQSGSNIDVQSGANFVGELSLSLIAVSIIHSWRKIVK